MTNLLIDKTMLKILITDKIEEIIKNLENNNYGDKSISFLEKELEGFCALALKIMNVKLHIKRSKITILNDHNKNQYLSYFNKLLNFYNNFINNLK
mgnify:CR=1 FL=1